MSIPFPALMTAMATPFDGDGRLDLPAAQRLATHLVDSGSGGLVVTGTTGEAPTLSDAESADLHRAIVEAVGDRASVLAGLGSNDTAGSVTVAERVHHTGVHGILLGTPYYSRPSQLGLTAHFTAVAATTDLPIMLYNIPARTACEIAPGTLLDLAINVDNIVAVKDAVGDMAKASWLANRAPQGFGIYSGDDKNCLPLLSVGGVGLVSVAAHLVGPQLAQMIDTFQSDPVGAREIHWFLGPLFDALFVEPSPAPLKWALAQLDLPGGTLRPPMMPLGPQGQVVLRQAMADVGIDPADTTADPVRTTDTPDTEDSP